MNTKWIGIGLGAVVVAGVVLMATRDRSEPQIKEPVEKPTNQVAKPAPRTTSPTLANPVTNSVSTNLVTASTSAVIDPETQRIADVLKRSYVPGGLPIQIKYQDELNRHWQSNPPSADAMVALIADQSAPAEFRIYFAKALVNMVKVDAFSAVEAQEALGDLRALILDASAEAGFRADLANVLTRVDQSSEAVQAVVPLLHDAHDDVSVKAVAALTHISNEAAITTVYEFVQDYQTLLDEKPQALMAALGPLATTTNDITPMVNHIFQTTDDFQLYAGAVQCLFYAQSSDEVLNAVASAYTASKRFTAEQLHAERICQAAAKKHASYYQQNRNELDDQTIAVLDDLLREN